LIVALFMFPHHLFPIKMLPPIPALSCPSAHTQAKSLAPGTSSFPDAECNEQGEMVCVFSVLSPLFTTYVKIDYLN